MEQKLSDIKALFGEKLVCNQELASLSTFNTGGSAKYFISVADIDEVSAVISKAKSISLPYFIMGGGSNLLISDSGFDGLVVKIDVTGLKLMDNNKVFVGAGEELMALVDFATENSLTGIEFASGIYGFIGGAICGNAGAYGGEMKDILCEVTIVTPEGELKKVDSDYCRFSYRDSYLKKSNDIVVAATIQLQNGDKEIIKTKVDEIIAIRSTKHPVSGKSAGSFFKNIVDASQPHGKLPAGKLLEQVGAKGMKIGGAEVYNKHANIIVNNGTATSADIRELADILKLKVEEKFGILLEEEVVSLGNF